MIDSGAVVYDGHDAEAPEARLARLRATIASVRAVPWLGTVTVTWCATRVLILMLAWCASWLATRHAIHYAEPGLFRGPRPLEVVGGWDGSWYRLIARVGYPAHFQPHHYSRLAFFPLLPLLIALVQLTGVSGLVAGLLVVNLASLCAFWAVAALTESYFGAEIAGRTAVYLAISPMAFVFGMIYTEALLVACGFGAAALMLRGRPWLAAPLALACGLSRPTGALIAVPLLAIAYRADRSRAVAFAGALAPVAGLAAFAAYAWWHTGDWRVFLQAEAAWGRRPASLTELVTLIERSGSQLSLRPSLWLLRDTAGFVMTLLLLAYGVRRKFPVSWLFFGFCCVIIPAASGSAVSMARLALVALPAFWALGILGRRPWFDQCYRLMAPALMSVGMLTVPLHWP